MTLVPEILAAAKSALMVAVSLDSYKITSAGMSFS